MRHLLTPTLALFTLALFTLATLVIVTAPAQAQWAPVGIDIKNTNSGNVLIGNPVSRSKLSINGGMSLNDPGNLNKVFIIGYNATKDYAFLSPWDWGSSTWRNLAINAGGGSVGIGTAPNSAYRLWVKGTTRTTTLIVDTGGADFVFEDGYELAPLEEVEAFIREHRHLPDVPPATELEENGSDVGAMQIRLLQKVEELTLYLIEQKKDLAQLQRENEQLREEVAALRTDTR